jgi:hypothetical protein
MKAYFDRVSAAVAEIGEIELLELFDGPDIDADKLKVPGNLTGWPGTNYPKLVISSIRLAALLKS